ncbi:hypothetical protein GWK47_050606 [Chionoecetes opilio]|uniref:Uncharacterized protein n=1 Tax=Chionoecetes opilio TaxID=41210 RepID=A0A8J5CTL7_CHIOP|nr:hypothetical protein GWK47_050606 [Chionoecetes opilio]
MEGGHPPYCDDCLFPVTVWHLLVECPSPGDLREHFLSRCRGRTVPTVSPWHWERGVSPRDLRSIPLLRGLAFSTSYDAGLRCTVACACAHGSDSADDWCRNPNNRDGLDEDDNTTFTSCCLSVPWFSVQLSCCLRGLSCYCITESYGIATVYHGHRTSSGIYRDDALAYRHYLIAQRCITV